MNLLAINTDSYNGSDGKKMSKSLKNYPDPNLVIDNYGADATRFVAIATLVTQILTIITDCSLSTRPLSERKTFASERKECGKLSRERYCHG